MISPLHQELARIAWRENARWLQSRLLVVWSFGAAAALTLWLVHPPVMPSFVTGLGIAITCGLAHFILWRIASRRRPDLREIALRVETAHPELRTALLAALDQRPGNSGFSFLQTRVIEEALAMARTSSWNDVVPSRSVTWRSLLQQAMAIATIVLLGLVAFSGMQRHATARRIASDVQVSPGNADVERGEPVTFTARFEKTVPATATLEIREANGEIRTLALERTLDDPVFAASLPAVRENLSYRIKFGDDATDDFQLKVFDLPKVERMDARLNYPEYTGKTSDEIVDARSISAIEQTAAEIIVRTNKPMKSVELRPKEGEAVPLEATPDDPTTFRTTLQLAESATYAVAVADQDDRRNDRAARLDVKVRRNKPPVVTARLPSKGDRATAIQEVSIEATAEDDFELRATGMTIQVAQNEPIEVSQPAGNETRKVALSRMVRLEEIGARPNDLIVWNAWAEDVGPDGAVRRTNGDIHIVPVRYFDEEKRQQEAAEGQAGEDRCLKCIRIQTDILQGTWNVDRDAAGDVPKPDEVQTLQDAQADNIELVGELEQEISDPADRRHATDAREAMERALAELRKSRLPPAVPEEQAALGHLYKLLSSRSVIALGQGPPPPGGGSPPMEEMELKDMQSRYQQETRGQDELTERGQEIRETLNRLKDLAQRQRDLNEEINRLIQALRIAKTDAERAEIERQLKRLRDQQRELLDDIDRSRQRMAENSQQTQSTGEEEARLTQARDSAAQVSQNLDRQKFGEALAEGTRAQQELEKAHEDYREQTSGELSEQLQELRRQAAELAENQRKLGEELRSTSTTPAQRTLSGQPDSFDARAVQQREDFENLMNSLSEASALAEESEPLVTKKLQEAARTADPGAIDRALETMQKAEQFGARSQAAAAGQAAQQAMDELERGIAEASAGILGSQEKALEFAQAELEDLRRSLESPPSPASSSEQQNANPASESDQQSESRASQNAQDGSQPGRQTDNGRQPGNEQNPENGSQPGEPGQSGQQSQTGQQPGPGRQSGQMPGEGQTPTSAPGGQAPGQLAQNSQTGVGSTGGGGDHVSGTNSGVIQSGGYQDWADRLQDIEAAVDVPAARDAIARARRAARDMRIDWKRNEREPSQELLRESVLKPLLEAEMEIRQALNRRTRRDPLAPVERDPVPDAYVEVVQRYYESLAE